MVGIKVVETIKKDIPVEPNYSNNPEYVTKSDLTDMFGQLKNQILPKSALSPEVHGVIKAVSEVQGLRDALQSPVAVGIEQSIGNLASSLLNNAFNNMQGGQSAAAPKPLVNSLAEIATHNISANLPQVVESLKSVLGTERIQQARRTKEKEHLPRRNLRPCLQRCGTGRRPFLGRSPATRQPSIR